MLQLNRAKFTRDEFKRLHSFLEQNYVKYNRRDFVENDPIIIPHSFSKLQDIEITAFWTSMLAWGQRKTIISKSRELFNLMDNAPHDFIVSHEEKDLKRFSGFKHRTFNYTDTLYFIHFLKKFYSHESSLENAFLCPDYAQELTVEKMLIYFHNLFFNDADAPHRTKKHVPNPASKSTCKRLNMFLRWMVRDSATGVDFGVWKNLQSRQLICPLDVHVERVARELHLLSRKQTDWTAACELTLNLRQFDSNDPVKYDFALFGTGVMSKMA